MIGAHHAAAKARLGTHQILSGKIDDVVRVTSTGEAVRANYVVLGTTVPGFLEDRLAAEESSNGDADVEFEVRAVAVDFAGVLLFMDAVSTQFIGHRLTVTGRDVSALRRTELDPVEYDPTARLFYMDAVFEATTSRI